jgi:hypothetical protein
MAADGRSLEANSKMPYSYPFILTHFWEEFIKFMMLLFAG